MTPAAAARSGAEMGDQGGCDGVDGDDGRVRGFGGCTVDWGVVLQYLDDRAVGGDFVAG